MWFVSLTYFSLEHFAHHGQVAIFNKQQQKPLKVPGFRVKWESTTLSAFTAISAAPSTPTKIKAPTFFTRPSIPKKDILTVVVDDSSPSGMLWLLQTREVRMAHVLMKKSNTSSALLPHTWQCGKTPGCNFGLQNIFSTQLGVPLIPPSTCYQ